MKRGIVTKPYLPSYEYVPDGSIGSIDVFRIAFQ